MTALQQQKVVTKPTRAGLLWDMDCAWHSEMERLIDNTAPRSPAVLYILFDCHSRTARINTFTFLDH